MGNGEPISAGKRVLEKELEKAPAETQWPEEQLNGPKNTKLDQQRGQTHREENLRVRKETSSVAHEEVKILREDLLREGESMDKKEPHHVSGEHGINSKS